MEQLRRLRQFLVEVGSEMKKTTWPSRREVYGTTVVVIVTVYLIDTLESHCGASPRLTWRDATGTEQAI